MATENLDSIQEVELSPGSIISELPVIHLPGVENLDSIAEVELSPSVFIFQEPTIHLSGTENLDSVAEIELSPNNYIIDPPPIHLPGAVTLETLATILDPGDNTIVLTGERIANFTATPREGDRPLIVEFQSVLPSYATLVQWDFGDGETSTDLNPAHIYFDAGNFEVKLTASMFGEEYTAVKKSFVCVGRVEVLPSIKKVRTHWSIFKNTFKVDPRE